MESLLQLSNRLQSLLTKSNPNEAAALLAWVQQGGFQSLQPALVAFLQEAITKPALVTTLKERWNRARDLNYTHLTREGEDLFGIDDIDGYYLAGKGYTIEELRRGVSDELKAENLERIASGGGSDSMWYEEENFVEGFDNPLVSERYANFRRLKAYLDDIDPPFPELVRFASSMKDDFFHYLAGAGVTPETLAKSSPVERAKLLAAFEVVHENIGQPFDAFIAGFEY